MTNAKEEYLDVTKDVKVIAAYIELNSYLSGIGGDNNIFSLKPLYKEDDYEKFLNFLDKEYDSGFGGQNLYGTIFCENGTWFSRGEYDGGEWWEEHNYPDMRSFFNESEVLKYERNKKLNKINYQ